jgi:multiple antibiotic resistance protein
MFSFSFNEILAVTFTLFAVIDVVGSIPVLISLKEKLGHIDSGKATMLQDS